MNSDIKILNNQKIIAENISDINCRSCKYYINKKCKLYIPIEHECLILIKNAKL